eukprot:TRINITY_DN17435_c0_g1_i9.p1 TRINITY_DN17435_c0_g1~~TRINITY_DN17435_c0_g1_i9.p1  ORF type:complete len:500 (+),score=71.19 TRINITY_DN17435_c0_g1_i9:93-1592(+)
MLAAVVVVVSLGALPGIPTGPSYIGRAWKGDRTLRDFLVAVFKTRPDTMGELLEHTDWSTVQRKTEWVEDLRRRRITASLPALLNAVRDHRRLTTTADPTGKTVLHYAAWVGAIELVPALLESGADRYARDELNHTAAHKAALQGYADVLGALVSGASRAFKKEMYNFVSGAGSAVQPSAVQRIFGTRQEPPVSDPQPRESHRRCSSTGGWAPSTDGPSSRCDIDRRTNLSPGEFYREYYLKGRPVLLRRAVPAKHRCAFTRRSLRQHGMLSEAFSCGPTAYPVLTNQTPCMDGEFKLAEIDAGRLCKSDVTPYAPYCVSKPVNSHQKLHNRTLPWTLLDGRILNETQPAFKALATPMWFSTVRFQFFMGAQGSGAALHWHRDAYSALFFGQKTWTLTPPAHAGVSGVPAGLWDPRTMPGPEPRAFSCTQTAGDVLVLPSGWGHRTFNHGMTLNIGNLYCNARRRGEPGACGTASVSSSALFRVFPAVRLDRRRDAARV